MTTTNDMMNEIKLIAQRLQRIETKLDILIGAIAAEHDDDDPEPVDLLGRPAGKARDPNEPL
jgi:hypothetical protein